MTRPQVAASIYLNAAPLCYSFMTGRHKDDCEFLPDAAPARCADLLKAGQADAALIPVVDYQRISGLRVVPGACVASRNVVKSVVLASRVPIEKVTSVALDTSSRTSAALIQIILRRFYGLAPRFNPAPPVVSEMLELNDSALVIGDPAMLIDRTSLKVYDLAEEWKKQTSLPFVFAFWAVRNDSRRLFGKEGVDFVEAKREGLEHLEEIASSYAKKLGLPESELLSYLRDNISYDLDQDALTGLDLYYRLAHEEGLIPEHRPLDYV
jgi:chorismate dehydratase